MPPWGLLFKLNLATASEPRLCSLDGKEDRQEIEIAFSITLLTAAGCIFHRSLDCVAEQLTCDQTFVHSRRPGRQVVHRELLPCLCAYWRVNVANERVSFHNFFSACQQVAANAVSAEITPREGSSILIAALGVPPLGAQSSCPSTSTWLFIPNHHRRRR